MHRDTFLALALAFCGLTYAYHDLAPVAVGNPVNHGSPRREAGLSLVIEGDRPQLSGLTSPDGAVRVTCDLPAAEKKPNVGGRDRAGLCVFTSVEYAARWQNERRLFDFQQKMRAEKGGGWPEKLDKMIGKYAPGVSYVQHTGGDMEFLRASLRSRRMPGVTYGGYDPHYRGYVAHMVSLVYLDSAWAAVTDNNFPKDDHHVWMPSGEFERRWKMGGGGWAVVLLSPPAPPKVID